MIFSIEFTSDPAWFTRGDFGLVSYSIVSGLDHLRLSSALLVLSNATTRLDTLTFFVCLANL